MKTFYRGNSVALLIFTVAGILVAGGIFLISFITTQKASTPYKYQNLRIPLMQVPTPVALPPTKAIFKQPSPTPTPATASNNLQPISSTKPTSTSSPAANLGGNE